MGVHGLWELLSPVGRRVSVETLAGKTLAVGTPQTLSLSFSLSPALSNTSFFFISPNCRCEHMDGAVYESDARREGRSGSQRPFAGLLPSHLQASLPPHQTGLRLRRRDPCPQAPHRRCPPPPARKRPSQSPQNCGENAAQSCMIFCFSLSTVKL